MIAERIEGVSPHIVQMVAHAAGYRWCVAQTKPHLKPSMVSQRRTWADHNTHRNWDGVMWADEAFIQTGEQPSWGMVTRKPGEEFLPECVVPKFQSGCKGIML